MRNLILSGLLSAAAVFATPVASVTFVGVPSNAPILGHDYVSPYTVSVNGDTNQAALCIDFNDDAPNKPWSAYLSTVGGDISNTYHPADIQQYEEEAYIFTEITKPGISAQTQTDLQEADWAIMNSDYYGTNDTYAPDAAALADITDAQNNYMSVNFSNFTILSSVNTPHAQEYLVRTPTPEPASCALFGGGLVLAGAFRFLRRKNVAKA